MHLHTFAREVSQVEASGGDCFRHGGVTAWKFRRLVFPMRVTLLEACPSEGYYTEYPGKRCEVSSFNRWQVVQSMWIRLGKDSVEELGH